MTRAAAGGTFLVTFLKSKGRQRTLGPNFNEPLYLEQGRGIRPCSANSFPTATHLNNRKY
jgi:hypothetical protein